MPQKVFDMMKAGISEDTFYSLFVQCFICQAVVFESGFPQDHCCSRRSKLEHGELESPQPIHLLDLANVEDGSTTKIPTDVETDTADGTNANVDDTGNVAY
ncbi:hypothetical protein BKA70DRAFT_1220255 [Coprinopsis sp. MPI-PUGE-AT-0042]|nr:hypothetical protein BKA70DRAFT_1220255 [Coprinopsis sp. MPI-PUGE-AT-0042]